MKVVFTPEAETQADAMDTWWREHRPAARDLFARELLEAVSLLSDVPTLGTKYRTSSGRELQRLLLPRTKNHLYFEVRLDHDLIIVHAVWGAPGGRGPSI